MLFGCNHRYYRLAPERQNNVLTTPLFPDHRQVRNPHLPGAPLQKGCLAEAPHGSVWHTGPIHYSAVGRPLSSQPLTLGIQTRAGHLLPKYRLHPERANRPATPPRVPAVCRCQSLPRNYPEPDSIRFRLYPKPPPPHAHAHAVPLLFKSPPGK